MHRLAAIVRLLPALLIVCSSAAFADPGLSTAEQDLDPDLKRGQEAIQRKDWEGAITALTRLSERDPSNADALNLLGFAERNRGNLDRAFLLYERALKLDPKHRGAHEYLGEAYLMVNNLAEAQAHLAALDKLCLLPCEEYTDLKRKIAEYRAKAKP
jgi:Flp pilus assembly protein TadD